MSSYQITVQNEDGIDTIEYVDPSADSWSRAYRLAVLLSYLTIEESVKVLDLIDNDLERKNKLLKAIDASFVLSIAAVEIKKTSIENNDIEFALVKVGINPDEIKNMNKWILGGIAASVAFVTFLFSRKGRAPTLSTECDDSIKAVHFGSVRDTSKIRLIIIHSTEGETAAGAAGWFANPASGGSTHYVVDDNKCFNTLPDNVIPWGAKGGRANEDGLHIELAGYAKRTRDEWLQHMDELKNAAAIVRMWSDKYNIPVDSLLSAEDLKFLGTNARGITTHANITKAFGVDTHTDPGNGFPVDVFLQLVNGKEINIS